ncbi:hypothetical protein P4O66_021186, partial [Electrophorus voltai]
MALPLATIICSTKRVPMLIRLKESKAYGTKRMIEGLIRPGDMSDRGGCSNQRQQCPGDHTGVAGQGVKGQGRGGAAGLSGPRRRLHLWQRGALPPSKPCLPRGAGGGGESGLQGAGRFAQDPPAGCTPLHADGGADQQAVHVCGRERCSEVLELADAVGPLVCALKTHVDVLCDFSPAVSVRLGELAREQLPHLRGPQVRGHWEHCGVYKISSWAHIVNAHALPGPGVVEALRVVGKPLGHGCLLIAQMSSQGCLATAEYTQTVVSPVWIELVKKATCLLLMFLRSFSSSKISSKPKHVHMTPGVQLRSGGDGLGQQYTSPVEVICSKRSDVIIVGRGILASPDRLKAAEEYRVA